MLQSTSFACIKFIYELWRLGHDWKSWAEPILQLCLGRIRSVKPTFNIYKCKIFQKSILWGSMLSLSASHFPLTTTSHPTTASTTSLFFSLKPPPPKLPPEPPHNSSNRRLPKTLNSTPKKKISSDALKNLIDSTHVPDNNPLILSVKPPLQQTLPTSTTSATSPAPISRNPSEKKRNFWRREWTLFSRNRVFAKRKNFCRKFTQLD